MIRIVGSSITIGDDITASDYRSGHPDFTLVLKTGETIHIPLRALGFAISVLASSHQCASFEDLWHVIGGKGWEWPGAVGGLSNG